LLPAVIITVIIYFIFCAQVEDTPLRDVVAALFSDLLPPRTRVGWADLRRHFLLLLLLGPVVAAEPAAEPHFQLHRAVGLRSSLAAATGRYSGSERRLIEVAVHAFSNAVILLFAGGAVVALDADSHAEVFSAQLELGGGCLLVRPGDRRKDNQDDEGDGENSRRQQRRRRSSSSSSSSSRGTRREGGLSAGVRGALDVMACAAGAPFFAVNLSSTVAEGGGGGASRDPRRRHRHHHHHDGGDAAAVAILESRAGCEVNVLHLRPTEGVGSGNGNGSGSGSGGGGGARGEDDAAEILQLALLARGNALLCTFRGSPTAWVFNATTGEALAQLPASMAPARPRRPRGGSDDDDDERRGGDAAPTFSCVVFCGGCCCCCCCCCSRHCAWVGRHKHHRNDDDDDDDDDDDGNDTCIILWPVSFQRQHSPSL
jgi:hypothetical protein